MRSSKRPAQRPTGARPHPGVANRAPGGGNPALIYIVTNVSRGTAIFSVNLSRKRAMFLSRGDYVLRSLQVAICLAHCAALTSPLSVYANSFAFRLLQPQAHGASLEFKGELKRWPILSMVCDKECLILLHRLRQFLKIGLRELSRQEICPALRMHRVLHHPLVVIR